MGVGLLFLMVDAEMVNLINPNPAVSMDDPVVAEDDAHMGDFAGLVGKERQVTRLCGMNERDFLSDFSLLIGIAWQGDTDDFEDYLREPGAVYPKHTATSPQVRGIVELVDHLLQDGRFMVVGMWIVGLSVEPILFLAQPKIDAVVLWKRAAQHYGYVVIVVGS